MRAVVALRDGRVHLGLAVLPHRLAELAGLLTHELAEAADLLEDHLLHLGDVLDDLEVEVEGGRAVGLVAGVVPDLQIAVLERLLDRDARRRVERQHAVQQIERVWIGVAEERLERVLLHERQVAHVLLRARRADARKRLLVGRAQVVQDLVQLVDVVAAFEEGLSAQELGQDATDGPDVDWKT